MGILEAGKELVEREVIATQTRNTIIIDDGTNEAAVPGFPYRFKAWEDKILVSVDIFKSGFECKECRGSGKLQQRCICETSDRPGFKYSETMLESFKDFPGGKTARETIPCADCKGDYLLKRIDEKCTFCNGTGAILHIPDSGKVLPTTGVIVSVGRSCLMKQQIRKAIYKLLPKFLKSSFSYLVDSELKTSTRVLFGAYTGVMIPTRAPGVVFKVLRDIEVLCIIKGGEDAAAFDFVNIDKEFT